MAGAITYTATPDYWTESALRKRAYRGERSHGAKPDKKEGVAWIPWNHQPPLYLDRRNVMGTYRNRGCFTTPNPKDTWEYQYSEIDQPFRTRPFRSNPDYPFRTIPRQPQPDRT